MAEFQRCPQCGYDKNGAGDYACGLCRALLRPKVADAPMPPAPEARADKRKAIQCRLRVPAAAPHVLRRSQATTIGRHKDCTLVLNITDASRKHCTVAWDGEHFVLRDEGSRNGTFLNGVRMQVHPLSHGDRIGIGSSEIVYEEAELDGQAGGQEDALEETRVIGTPDGVLSGDTSRFPLANILEMISVTRKSGKLVLSNDAIVATLYFRAGVLLDAALGGVSGEEAAFRVLQMEGYFRFVSESSDRPRVIQRGLTELLLEAARRADERSASETIRRPRR